MSPASTEGSKHCVPKSCRVVLAVLVVVIAVAGCASSGRGKDANPPTTKDSTAPTPVAAASGGGPTTLQAGAIAAELLVTQDLPPGWSQFAPAAGAGPQNRGCLSQLTSSNGRLNRAEAQFLGGPQDSEYVDEVLESFGPGGALAEIVHFRQVVAACTQVKVAASGLGFTGRITTISLPTFGDDSTAYRVDLTTNAGTVSITLGYGIVIARRGDTVLVLVASSVDPTSVDQLLPQIAEGAMAKIT